MREERDKFKNTLHRIIHQTQQDDITIHPSDLQVKLNILYYYYYYYYLLYLFLLSQNQYKSKLYTFEAEQIVQRDLDLLDVEIGNFIHMLIY